MTENNKMTGVQRVFLIIMIFFIVLCIFIPVWQSGQNQLLRSQLNVTAEQISNLKNQENQLEADIARTKSPEFLIQQSKTRKIAFSQVFPESALYKGGI